MNMYLKSDLETLDRKDLEKIQLERLQKTVLQAYKSEFYRTRLQKANVRPEDIRSLEDIKKIPFTTKDDLRKAYPYGMLAVDKKEIVRMHASSGTTGTPTVIFHTRHDLYAWTELVARSLYMAGMRDSDVFQNMMTYGLFTGGLGLHYGAEQLGMMVIPASSGNTRRQVQLIQDFHTTAVHITPSYALHLGDDVENYNVKDPRDLGLKFAVMGAEPYSEAVTRKIEERFGLVAFNCYGLSEMNGPAVAFECPAKNGLHIWEDNYFAEIIDPVSEEVLGDGQKGELVLTTLNREGMPILRYRTKDLTTMSRDKCSCGRTHARIERILGRADDMMIIGGVNVFPSQIEHVLMEIPEVGSNYQIILRKKGYLDKLHVNVEINEKFFAGDISWLHTIQKKIEKELKSALLVTATVNLVEPGVIPPSMGKAQRVVDERNL